MTFFDGTSELGTDPLTSAALSDPNIASFDAFFGSLDSTSYGSLLWGDVNGDGQPDLISYGTTFQVFLSNGNQTFHALSSQPYALSSYTFGPPILIDFNGDGAVDMLSLTSNGTVQLLYGNGTGVFQAPVPAPGITLPSPSNPAETDTASYLSANDLTGSGRSDILVGSRTSTAIGSGSASPSTVTVFKNNGNGSFTSIGRFPIAAASTIQSQTISQMLLVDLNGDAKSDLVVSASNGSPLPGAFASVLLNQGDGTFASPYVLYTSTFCAHGCSIALSYGDFARRGKTDLILSANAPLSSGSATPSTLRVYPGNNDGSFAAAVTSNALSNNGQITVEDINGDGKPDLIDNLGYVYLGNGDFTFGSGVGLPQTNHAQNVQLLCEDFNQDGIADLLFNYPSAIAQLGTRDAISSLPSISSLTAGVHPIVATYSGDANFTGSTSATIDVAISKFTSTVTGAADPNPALSTQNVELVAKVKSNSPTAPTGTVAFSLGSQNLGVGAVRSDGTASISVIFGNAATQNVQATYSGDTNISSANTSFQTLTVSSFPSTTTFSISPNPTLAGQSVVLTALIHPAGTSPTPTGSVTFLNGSTQIGTAQLDTQGKATFNTSFATTGNQTITANYLGDSANQPSSASFVEAVLEAFNIQPSQSSTSLVTNSGSPVATPISISSSNGFAGSISFSCSGLPASATCSFSPSVVQVSAAGTATVNLTVVTSPNLSAKNDTGPTNIFSAVIFFTLLGFNGTRRKKISSTVVLTTLCLSAVLFTLGCGGSHKPTTTPSTYNFNVVASSGTIQKTIAYTLTIN